MLVCYRITVEMYIIYNKLETERCWRVEWTVEGYISSDTRLLNAASYGCSSSNPDAKEEFPQTLGAVVGAQVGCKPPFPKGWHWDLRPFPLLTGSGVPLPRSPLLLVPILRAVTGHSTPSLPPSRPWLLGSSWRHSESRPPYPFPEPLPHTLSLRGRFRGAPSGWWVLAVLNAHHLGHAPSPPFSASARPHFRNQGAETLRSHSSAPGPPGHRLPVRAQSPGALGAVRKRAALTAIRPHARLPTSSPPPHASLGFARKTPTGARTPQPASSAAVGAPQRGGSPGSAGSHAFWTTSGKGQTVSGT